MSQTSSAIALPSDGQIAETPRFEVLGAAREVMRRVKSELPDHFPDPNGKRADDVARMVERFASANRPAGILLTITASDTENATHEIELLAEQTKDKPHPITLDPGTDGTAPLNYADGKALQAGKEQALKLCDEDGNGLLVSICAIDGIDKASQIDLILRRMKFEMDRLRVIMGMLQGLTGMGEHAKMLGDQLGKLRGHMATLGGHHNTFIKLLEEAKKEPENVKPEALAKAMNGMMTELKEIIQIPGLPPAQREAINTVTQIIQAMPTTFPVLATTIPHLNNNLFPQAAIQQQTVQRAEVKVEAKTAANPAPVANAQKIMAAAKNDNPSKADAGTRAENTQRRFSVVAKPVAAERLAERIQQPDTKAPAQAAPSLRVVGGNPDAPRTTAPEARKAFTVVGRDAGERVLQTLTAKAAEPAKPSGQTVQNAAAPLAQTPRTAVPTQTVTPETKTLPTTPQAQREGVQAESVKANVVPGPANKAESITAATVDKPTAPTTLETRSALPASIVEPATVNRDTASLETRSASLQTTSQITEAVHVTGLAAEKIILSAGNENAPVLGNSIQTPVPIATADTVQTTAAIQPVTINQPAETVQPAVTVQATVNAAQTLEKSVAQSPVQPIQTQAQTIEAAPSYITNIVSNNTTQSAVNVTADVSAAPIQSMQTAQQVIETVSSQPVVATQPVQQIAEARTQAPQNTISIQQPAAETRIDPAQQVAAPSTSAAEVRVPEHTKPADAVGGSGGTAPPVIEQRLTDPQPATSSATTPPTPVEQKLPDQRPTIISPEQVILKTSEDPKIQKPIEDQFKDCGCGTCASKMKTGAGAPQVTPPAGSTPPEVTSQPDNDNPKPPPTVGPEFEKCKGICLCGKDIQHAPAGGPTQPLENVVAPTSQLHEPKPNEPVKVVRGKRQSRVSSDLKNEAA